MEKWYKAIPYHKKVKKVSMLKPWKLEVLIVAVAFRSA
jgi:hypothetical protein